MSRKLKAGITDGLFIAFLPFRKMSLFAQKSRPEMVATIYGSSQAQLSERLGSDMRCDARGVLADVKKAAPSLTQLSFLTA